MFLKGYLKPAYFVVLLGVVVVLLFEQKVSWTNPKMEQIVKIIYFSER